MLIPVILAGGSGTRLWPLSRELYPKQLLPLMGETTLLQNTLLRISGLEDMSPPIILCNENHRFLVAEQLRAINVIPLSIILEPVGRNTAPAIATAALFALSKDKDAVLLVLPADHHIGDTETFRNGIQAALHFAKAGHLITFGVYPTAPETGYGYIRKGETVSSLSFQAMRIGEFVEKPDRDTAEKYIDSGAYFWNSGMFVFKASAILKELENLAPRIVQSCREAKEKGSEDLDFFRLDKEAFSACPSDSIDYAVMEKTQKGLIIPLSSGWNDLGSFDSLWEVQEKDADGNVSIGDVLVQDVRRSYLHSTSRLLAAIGIENHVVVETPDAVLISPWDRVQEVKGIVQKLKEGNREEALCHRRVYRPWGSYESISCDKRFQVKRIVVKPGAKLSLQKHYHRAEHWIVVHGTALVMIGNEERLLSENESTFVPLGMSHRLENPGKIPLELIEVQSGSYLGEDDIQRMDDVYGRKD